MRSILYFLISFLGLSFIAFAGGGHGHGDLGEGEFELSKEIVEKLNIKWDLVKEREISLKRKYPAVVKDDLTLSEAVYSPVEGIVKKLFVKEGDPVKKGQKLALIYSPEIRKLIADIKLAQVKVRNLKAVYEREKKLYEAEVIPYGRFFTAKINYENALGELNALKESLRAYGEIEGTYLVLKSHMDGYVAVQNVVLGDSVDLSKQLFKIHSHEKLWVVALVPVGETGIFKEGMNVDILSPLGKTKGFVDFISHKVDPETKRNEVRIIGDNSNDTLKPNMFVDVLVKKKKVKGIFIPEKAVVLKDGKFYVFQKENSHVSPVEVVLGEKIDGFYRLIDGLHEGDQIIVEGVSFLKSRFLAEVEGH
ncbi:MAG TPA: efflux RND transporter periplasmic adaptor subunit [Persephonella sp.]|uniref:Cation efflux system n=1 Tax=Persephonella marina (strain DSM 14350 / EX-H1) TaxID=123214 RepID=C0QPR9_PERMH|nr:MULTISPECIES: efflux RND transporter periplasmic adaptor subunit [Persephonella]ACO04534.1 cation efflux system [Persephonella marina EX-H1]HCB69720.1 efflux RND transporter periplasmic adaptor subunit [Persephonella sp.]